MSLREKYPPRQEPAGPIQKNRAPQKAPKKPKRINTVNRARKEARNALAFGPQARAARMMPCCVCSRRPCDPAHVKSRGAGGKDCDVVPLCSGPRGHHQEQHSIGLESFQEKHRIILEVVAGELAQAVKQHECAAWVVLDEKVRSICALCEATVDDSEVTP